MVVVIIIYVYFRNGQVPMGKLGEKQVPFPFTRRGDQVPLESRLKMQVPFLRTATQPMFLNFKESLFTLERESGAPTNPETCR